MLRIARPLAACRTVAHSAGWLQRAAAVPAATVPPLPHPTHTHHRSMSDAASNAHVSSTPSSAPASVSAVASGAADSSEKAADATRSRKRYQKPKPNKHPKHGDKDNRHSAAAAADKSTSDLAQTNSKPPREKWWGKRSLYLEWHPQPPVNFRNALTMLRAVHLHGAESVPLGKAPVMTDDLKRKRHDMVDMALTFIRDDIAANPARFRRHPDVLSIYHDIFYRIRSEETWSHAVPLWRKMKTHLRNFLRKPMYQTQPGEQPEAAAQAQEQKEETELDEDGHQQQQQKQDSSPAVLGSSPPAAFGPAPRKKLKMPEVTRVSALVVSAILQCLLRGGYDVARVEQELAFLRQLPSSLVEITADCYAPILKEHILRAKSNDFTQARAYLDQVPLKNAFLYTSLINAYVEAGLISKARALSDEMRTSGVPLTNMTATVQLKLLLAAAKRSTPAERELLIDEVEQWWSHCMLHHSQMLVDGSVAASVIKFYQHADGNNIERQTDIIDEAMALEEVAVREEMAQGKQLPAYARPVYVHIGSLSMLAYSCAHSKSPVSWVPTVEKYTKIMTDRAEAAKAAFGFTTNVVYARRCSRLQLDHVTIGSLLLFAMHSRQHEHVMHVWNTLLTPQHKSSNQHAFVTMLNYCAHTLDTELAERVMVEFDATGAPWNNLVLSAYIGCYVKLGDFVQAERIWERARTAGLTPNANAFAHMIAVYVRATAKNSVYAWHIDRLIEMMPTAGPNGTPLWFDTRDFGHLVKESHGARQSQLMNKFLDMAKKQGVSTRQPPKLLNEF